MIRPGYRRLGFAASALVISMLLPGCSGGVRVSGNVTLDGQPIDGGTISFFAEGMEKQRPVSGEIVDGKYAIKLPMQNGNYRVEIHWFKKTGKQIPGSDPPNMEDEKIQVVPKQYNADSKTTVEIKSGSNSHDFNLKSK